MFSTAIRTDAALLLSFIHFHSNCYASSYCSSLFVTDVLILFLILQFLKEITHSACDKTIEQPTTQTVRDDFLISQGPVVTYRSFKHGKRRSRAIAETEYYTAAESLQLEGFGNLVEFGVPRGRGSCSICTVFYFFLHLAINTERINYRESNNTKSERGTSR